LRPAEVEGVTTLDQLWARLSRVSSLKFVARSGKANGWNGTGSGTVAVRQQGEGVITFNESGTWRPEVGPDTRFSNAFRWTLSGDVLRLEHLRFGETIRSISSISYRRGSVSGVPPPRTCAARTVTPPPCWSTTTASS